MSYGNESKVQFNELIAEPHDRKQKDKSMWDCIANVDAAMYLLSNCQFIVGEEL